jgi:EpsI family protein
MRVEPVTYWIIIGDKVPATGVARKLEQMKYTLTGRVPDGLLFRVSHIQRHADVSYTSHTRFINDLLKGMKPDDRVRLVGKSL